MEPGRLTLPEGPTEVDPTALSRAQGGYTLSSTEYLGCRGRGGNPGGLLGGGGTLSKAGWDRAVGRTWVSSEVDLGSLVEEE